MFISIQKNLSSFLIALSGLLFQSVDIKSFYSNTCYGFEYKKTASVNCLLKLKKKKPEKPKRKTKKKPRAEKVYADRMLLSFKTSVTCKKLF